MTGHELDRQPTSTPEWARQVSQRLRRLESPGNVRVGEWVLSVRGGDLTAVRPGFEPVVLSSPAAVVDGDGPKGPRRSSGDLPAVMPDDWWNPLLDTLRNPPAAGNQPVDAIGQFFADMWAMLSQPPTVVPIGALTGDPPNLLLNPSFSGSVSMAGAGIWDWDPSVYLTEQVTDNGSATTVADGSRKVLASNIVRVTSGQTLNVLTRFAANGLVGSGALVALQVATYDSDGQRVGVATVQSASSVTGSASTWTGLSGAAKAGILAGGWVVPAGVASVRLLLVVTAGATAGRVWFDSAALLLDQKLPKTAVDGLVRMDDWLGRLFADIPIVLDLLHWTYQEGNPSDGPNQLGSNGKRTWWAAWNDLMSVLGFAPGQVDADPLKVQQQFYTVDENQQTLTRAIKVGADGTSPLDTVSADQAHDAVSGLRNAVLQLQTRVNSIGTEQRPGGKLYTAQGLSSANNWSPFILAGDTAAAARDTYGFQWVKSGQVDRVVWGRYPQAFNTDQHMVEMNIGVPTWDSFGTFSGSNMLFLRANAALTELVYLLVQGKVWKLFATNAGTDTLIGSGTVGAGSAPSRWQVFALGNTYTVYKDGISQGSFTSTLVAANSLHRYGGIGMASKGDTGWHSEWVPATIASWMGRDSAPVTVTGSGLYIQGATSYTSPLWTGTDGSATVLPRELYEISPLYQSDDIAVTAYSAGQGFANAMAARVFEEGWYVVESRVNTLANASQNFTQDAYLRLDSNLSNPVWSWGGLSPCYGSGSSYIMMGLNSWITYCKAGDYLYPAGTAYLNRTTFRSDKTNGYEMHFAVARVGTRGS